MNQPVLSTGPLSRSDKLDLVELLPRGSAVEQAVELPPGELGEPVTVVLLITLSIAALTGISAWLASRGKDVEMTLGLQVPGVTGSFTFKARTGDTVEDIVGRLREYGLDIPPD